MILELVTIKEAAEMLGVSDKTLYRQVNSDSDRLRGVRCGSKDIRILREDVERYQPRQYPKKERTDGE